MDDLISRQAMIDAMAELQARASTKAELKGISKIWKRIKKLPSAQPERNMGKWIYPYETTTLVSICSECGSHGKGNYCPNCGADMNGGEQE